MFSVRFLIWAGGVFSAFWAFGLLQERLFKGTFGPDKETFTFVLSLTFITQIVNTLYPYAVIKIRKIQSVKVPATYQWLIATAYLMAMVTSFAALQWVSYPAQVLAKSSKPIPVLLMGVLLGKRSYHIARYFAVILIVAGVCMFMYNDEKAAKSGGTGFGKGELLLAASLILDGFYNALQERVMSNNRDLQSEQFMLDINLASLVLSGIASFAFGDIFKFVAFVEKYPMTLLLISAITLLSAIGQFCIYKLITEFGTLSCSIVTTTRKFFTVLGSIVIFAHVLKIRQWLSIVLVFTGLSVDIYFSRVSMNPRDANGPTTSDIEPVTGRQADGSGSDKPLHSKSESDEDADADFSTRPTTLAARCADMQPVLHINK